VKELLCCALARFRSGIEVSSRAGGQVLRRTAQGGFCGIVAVNRGLISWWLAADLVLELEKGGP
jgi:hypothetical protein